MSKVEAGLETGFEIGLAALSTTPVYRWRASFSTAPPRSNRHVAVTVT